MNIAIAKTETIVPVSLYSRGLKRNSLHADSDRQSQKCIEKSAGHFSTHDKVSFSCISRPMLLNMLNNGLVVNDRHLPFPMIP